MKYFICVVLLLSLAPLFLNAQSNYKPGYVVNFKNDTLNGFIDYREWARNPEEITFKQTLGGSPQKISVLNANAFGITNSEYYDRFVVNITTSTVELTQLSHKLDTAYVTDTVFLKNVVDGKNISLYVYTNSIKSSYYVLDKRLKTIISLKQYLYYNEENRSISSINSYTGQLLRLAVMYQPDNNGIQTRIQKATYTESDLSDIAIRINGGTKAQQSVHINSSVRFFAGGGVRSSRLQFKGDNTAAPFKEGSSDNAFSPVISGGMDFLLNKYTERLVVRLEVAAAMNRFKFSTQQGTGPTKYDLDFKQFNAAITPQILYNFYSTDNLKAFFDVGLAVNVFKYNNYNYVTTYSYGVVTTKNKYPQFQSLVISLPIKAGTQINKHIEIYGTYWIPASITRYIYYTTDLSAFQFGVNYLFK